MTGREFLNRVSHGQGDLLQAFLDLLQARKVRFCLIGGLAVNAYAEPVVSLDVDVVIASEQIERLIADLRDQFTVEPSSPSINLTSPLSDLRIQLQTDPRYQAFIERATVKEVLGYQLPVARIEDVLQGKIWAATDAARRPSKRQKDLADIARLIEVEPRLRKLLPDSLARQLVPESLTRHLVGR